MTYEIDFGEYFDYAALGSAFDRDWRRAYPALAALDVIGSSWRGRDIYCMTITNAKPPARTTANRPSTLTAASTPKKSPPPKPPSTQSGIC